MPATGSNIPSAPKAPPPPSLNTGKNHDREIVSIECCVYTIVGDVRRSAIACSGPACWLARWLAGVLVFARYTLTLPLHQLAGQLPGRVMNEPFGHPACLSGRADRLRGPFLNHES